MWFCRLVRTLFTAMRLLLRNFGLPAPRGGVVQGSLLAARCSLHMANHEPAELFCRGWPVRHSFAPVRTSASQGRSGCCSPWKSHVTHVTLRFACDSSVHGILTGRALNQANCCSLPREPRERECSACRGCYALLHCPLLDPFLVPRLALFIPPSPPPVASPSPLPTASSSSPSGSNRSTCRAVI
jgi:hypothetical protein